MTLTKSIESRVLEALQHLQPAWRVDAARHGLVDHHPHADDELGADTLADRGEHLPREAQAGVVHPALVPAAPLVVAVVGERRQELVEQVPVRLDLDPVHAAGLHALGGVGVLADDALDVPLLGDLGDVAVRGLADRRGGHDREPVVLAPPGAAAEMGDLDHAGRAVLVHLVGEPADPGDDLVLVGVQVAERRRAVLGHHGRAGGHRHADAALRLLDVVEPVAVGGHAALRVRGLVRRREHPVAQREVLQRVRLQQRIVGDHQRTAIRGSSEAWLRNPAGPTGWSPAIVTRRMRRGRRPVVVGGVVHRRPVVPDHHVAVAPTMAQHEFGLRACARRACEAGASLSIRDSSSRCVVKPGLTNSDRATGHRMDAHDRVHHRRHASPPRRGARLSVVT